MDSRLKKLSYSSLLTLHVCPRKFQLKKLSASEETPDTVKESSSNVTFAFGHVVGEGIQLLLSGATIEETIWRMYLGWHADLAAENEKQNKSFYSAVIAVQKFAALQASGFLAEYELVYYKNVPAVELSFCINFLDDFKYRGYVDVVLRNRDTQEIMVLELKTSSSNSVEPATYKNSAQALGYSIVLDVLFPALSSYKVLYLVYSSKAMEYETLEFTKSFVQRALWIQELLLDIEMIKVYEAAEVYPMHGESCYDWYRECEFLNTCTLQTKYLVTAPPEGGEEIDDEVFTINVSLSDLVHAQLNKETGV